MINSSISLFLFDILLLDNLNCFEVFRLLYSHKKKQSVFLILPFRGLRALFCCPNDNTTSGSSSKLYKTQVSSSHQKKDFFMHKIFFSTSLLCICQLSKMRERRTIVLLLKLLCICALAWVNFYRVEMHIYIVHHHQISTFFTRSKIRFLDKSWFWTFKRRERERKKGSKKVMQIKNHFQERFFLSYYRVILVVNSWCILPCSLRVYSYTFKAVGGSFFVMFIQQLESISSDGKLISNCLNIK